MTSIHFDPEDFRPLFESYHDEQARRFWEFVQSVEKERGAVDRDGLADWASVSVSTVDRWRKRDGLPHIKLANGKPLFLLDSVREWMKSREIVVAPEEDDKEPVPCYTVVLKPLPDKSDPTGIRRLRAALKCLLRSYRLKAERCVPEAGKGGDA